ncbi:MAG: hypothetical protein GY811_13760 [Myxococcales bacterium]|nr:hypothetical protein [Myxococcales bacterium]
MRDVLEVAAPLLVAEVLIVARLLEGDSSTRHLAVLITLVALPLPWLLPWDWPVVRALAALAVTMTILALASVSSPFLSSRF